MNLEPLRSALRTEASAEADRQLAEAEAAAARRLAGARTEAEAIVERGRREGEELAAKEARRQRAAATRRARELRLEAQRSLIDQLRSRTREAALQLRADRSYPHLLERLSEAARTQLGPDAEIEVDPPALGGVIARAGAASVDYTLPALADRAIDDLGTSVERLWR